jgi:hypothetical protein
MKQVPLAEAARLREQRRKLEAKVALLEAEKHGWLAEKARLIAALEGRSGSGDGGKRRAPDLACRGAGAVVLHARLP